MLNKEDKTSLLHITNYMTRERESCTTIEGRAKMMMAREKKMKDDRQNKETKRVKKGQRE
jgi:hypothetical protein